MHERKLQRATESRRFYPKGGGCARSTGKSIEELKKVTSCNRCGAIGHWEEDCTQPARSRKKGSPLQRAKEKVVGSGERNLMVRDEEVHRTTRLWVSTKMVGKIKRHIRRFFLDTRFWIVVLPKVCVERNLSLRWHRHVHEKVNELRTSATLWQSLRVIISEESEIRLSVHS